MDSREKLSSLRSQIDEVDRQMAGLFDKRMQISAEVGRVKAEGGISLVDNNRESQVIDAALREVSEESRPEVIPFMRSLMSLSKIRQLKEQRLPGPVQFPSPATREKKDITAAYQGVEGAWGQQGAMLLFPEANLVRRDYFDDVFGAVKSGEADFGVLPIENSQTGAIGEVYDLLRSHGCYIVGEMWITIAQCLLAREGASISDIREVFSHPEGFNQCRRFLRNRSWDLTACRNTAVAAKAVAEKGLDKFAAIGSRRAAQAYGLQVLVPDIMDSSDNKTRFIAIAAKPFYDESSTTTSITFSTAHKSGALCAVLESFMLSGINLKRIESRPAPGGNYRFFADLEASVLSGATRDALSAAAMQCEYFEVLGCYSESMEH